MRLSSRAPEEYRPHTAFIDLTAAHNLNQLEVGGALVSPRHGNK